MILEGVGVLGVPQDIFKGQNHNQTGHNHVIVKGLRTGMAANEACDGPLLAPRDWGWGPKTPVVALCWPPGFSKVRLGCQKCVKNANTHPG